MNTDTNNQKALPPIKKGDRIWYKKEWLSFHEEDKVTFIAAEDEDGGRVLIESRIFAIGVNPTHRIKTEWVRDVKTPTGKATINATGQIANVHHTWIMDGEPKYQLTDDNGDPILTDELNVWSDNEITILYK